MKRILIVSLVVYIFYFIPVYGAKQSTISGELVPELYGAKGDGTHDDTEAIQQAIDKLVEIGGGTVRLGSGTYLISSVKIGPKVSLVGNGNGATIVKQARGQKKDCIIVKDIAAALRIADLTVLGEMDNNGIFFEQSGGFGENHHYLYSNTSHWDKSQAYKWITIDNVCVYRFNVGMNIQRWGFNINISNSTFSHNNKGVIMSCTDSFLYNCYITNNSIAGLIVDGSNNKVSNVKSIFNCRDGAEKYAAIVVYGSRCQLLNCETQDNYGKGFLINGIYNELCNCLSNTDGYGKNAYRYDPDIKACGFQINGLFNTFSNCAVTNYNENYGAVYHSPVNIADSVSFYYPDIFDDIRILIAKDRLMFHEPFRNVQTLGSKNQVERLNIVLNEGGNYFVSNGKKDNVVKYIGCYLNSLQLLVDFKCNGSGNLIRVDGNKSFVIAVDHQSILLSYQGERIAELDLDDDAVLDKDDMRLIVAFGEYQKKSVVKLLMYEKTSDRGWIKKETSQETVLAGEWLQRASVKVGDKLISAKRLAISNTPFPESVFLPSSNTNKIYNSASVYIDADASIKVE